MNEIDEELMFAISLLETIANPIRRPPSLFVDLDGYTNVPTLVDMPTMFQ